MAYKTIVVHVNRSNQLERRVGIAARLARDYGAHLVGAATSGISRFLQRDYATSMGVSMAADCIDEARADARRALEGFERQCNMLEVPSVESRLVDDEVIDGLALQSRYCDLAVLSQTSPDEPLSPMAEELPEYIAMYGARPVLVIPYAGHFNAPFRKVLAAWDGSMEATRAFTAAIPLMQKSDQVTVVVFNAGRAAVAHGEEPGADIALYLARHGINVRVSRQETDIEIGAALLSMAADLESDLLVMGCYGHSRFRELMLGGATRTVLQSMTLPVLLAH